MYPQRELSELGAHKAALQRRIARQRIACVVAASRMLQPVAWLDRMLAHWRRFASFAPLAVVPFALLLKRTVAPRGGMLAKLLSWGPVVFGAVRGLSTARRPVTRA